MRATMADIARETGLTLGTVSRALNTEGKYAIAPETRERVFSAATKLGYRPNRIGSALASGSSALVLLISPDPFAPYYVEISRHLSAQAAGHGYSFVTGGTLLASDDRELSTSDWLYGVDGIVVCDYLPHQEAHIREAMRLHIPTVGLGVRYPFPGDFVQVDIAGAASDLMQHLLAQGSTRPAFLTGSMMHGSDPRRAAYLQVTGEAGLEPRILVAREQSRAAGREAIVDSALAGVADGDEIDAIFCENEVLASGAYRGLLDQGRSVPRDVLLAACDGLDEASYGHTPLTTILQPLERMCEIAWTMLQERISGETGPERRITLRADLQVRASTSR